MKDYEFLDAIGGIENRFVEKAANRKAKRTVWKYVTPVAACLVLLIGVYFAYPKLTHVSMPVQVPVPDPGMQGTIERTDEPETYPENPPILRPGDEGYIDPAPTTETVPEPSGPVSDANSAFLPEASSADGDYAAMITIAATTYIDTYEKYLGEIDENSIQHSVAYTDGYPQNDGEQNFDRENVDYIIIDDATVICQIDGEWIVFRPFRLNDGTESPDIALEDPNRTSDNQEILNGKPMISSYGVSTGISDMAVDNGGIFMSDSLTSAMDQYKDTVNYRVLIDLFRDGVQVSANSEFVTQETQRLFDLGYVVAIECVKQEVNQGGYVTVTAEYYFTLHATYEQLKDFSANSELGYSMMLYGEYFGEAVDDGITSFSGGVEQP